MSITSYSQVQSGSVTVITVASDLPESVLYHWYVDGVYVDTTVEPERAFFLQVDEQAEIVCVDAEDDAIDPRLLAPKAYPARRTLVWVRSVDTSVVAYRVDQKIAAGDWTEIGLVPVDGDAWEYRYETEPLTDLTLYQWRIVPLDAAGNGGTALELDAETVVRRPDAPNVSVTFDDDTQKVTISAA